MEMEQEKEKDKIDEVNEEEEIESCQEDEEEKGLMKNDKKDMKKKLKEVESSHRVPKWKLAKGLKEKESDDIEYDEWGIPKVPDRILFP
ncbi:hypothetical protein ACS0TY_024454 [Phlomoides rotata]